MASTDGATSGLRPIVAAYWWLVAAACFVVRFIVLTTTGLRTLGLAILLLGIFIAVQFVLDLIWG